MRPSSTTCRRSGFRSKPGAGQAAASMAVGTFLVSVTLIGGCGIDFAYLLPAAAGQLDLLWNSVPVSRALEDGDLTEEQLAKLQLIREVRVYARDVMGLNVADNFTTFYDSGSRPVAFNVSASRKDALKPRLWSFPIVGTVPYLGFFDRMAADAKFDSLAAEGLDVFMYEIDAYSALGFFPNPILSPMLERSEISLVDTVLHELLHATVWRPGDTTFNESLATFSGRTGAIEYFRDRRGDEPDVAEEAQEFFDDADLFSEAMLGLFNELDEFYSSDAAAAAKIAGREAIYQAARDRLAAEVLPLMNRPQIYEWGVNLPTNNAWILGVRRYNLDLQVFEQVFQATGEDWEESLRLFAAASTEPDPYAYLRSWLQSLDVGHPEKASPSRG